MLTSVSDVAPASTAARAIAVRSVTFGESFARTGRSRPASTTAPIAAAVASGWWAKICSRAWWFGQLTFTSIATSPSRAGSSNFAARPKSSTVVPHTDAITRAPAARSAGRSSAIHAVTPGPCSPTAFNMPAAVMCSRGAGLPGHGSADSDFAVIAPSRHASPSFATSAPCPYVPDAVTIGFGNVNPPSLTSVSTSTSPSPTFWRRCGHLCRSVPTPKRERRGRDRVIRRVAAGRRGGTPGESGRSPRGGPSRAGRPRPRGRRRPW